MILLALKIAASFVAVTLLCAVAFLAMVLNIVKDMPDDGHP